MNVFDAVVVLVSFGLQIRYVMNDGQGRTSFLGILRIVRLLRLFVVMNKIQNQSKQHLHARNLRLNSSPAERVVELLGQLKSKVAARPGNDKLADDIDWIMQLIVAEKLYTIELKTDKIDGEMSAFLLATVGSRKKRRAGMRGMVSPTETEGTPTSPNRRSNVKAVRFSIQDIGAVPAVPSSSEIERKDKVPPADEGAVDRAELERLEAILATYQAQEALFDIHSWGFDVFDFHAKTGYSGLVVGAYELMESYGLIECFDLNVPKMAAFFRRIQDGYRDNPYHNCVHALDVMLNTSYFMRQEAIIGLFTPLEKLAAILAAAIHDHDHPGLNNQFLIATRHEWAVLYNDQSVLESHHIASAWRILLQVRFSKKHSLCHAIPGPGQRPHSSTLLRLRPCSQDEYNFIAKLTAEEYKELRELVIQLILATDMRYHFEHASKLKTRCSANAFAPNDRHGGEASREDVHFLLCALVHAADIANGLKPSALALKWSAAVMEEFYRQGDLEAALGMPVSRFCDRATTSIADCQLGFLNIIVKPYFELLCGLLGPHVVAETFDQLRGNITDWETYGNRLIQPYSPLLHVPQGQDI
eukprot:scaffold66739_cov32-Tisochrysis_lutea.AAC.3